MAFSRVAGGSNNRQRTTRTNYSRMSPGQRRRSLLGNTAANNAASERFRRRRATQAASQPPAPTTDPLTNVLSQQQQMMLAQGGGSMGAQPSMADAQGSGGATAPVNQQPSMADAQGTGASQPANMPPPPPPPPPAPPAPQPTMAQMQGTGAPPAPQPTMAEMQGGGNVARQPTMAEMQGTGSVIPQPTMAQMQGTGNDAPLQPATQPTMAEMQGSGNVAPQPTMAEMQGGAVQTTAFDPNQQYRQMFSQGISGDINFNPPPRAEIEASMREYANSPELESQVMAQIDANPGSISEIIKNNAIGDRIKAAALAKANQRGGSIPGGQQLGVGPSMADAQGSGQPSAPTLSPGEEMAMRQNAANIGFNDRLALALGGDRGSRGGMFGVDPSRNAGIISDKKGNKRSKPSDAGGSYTNPYEQAALLQRGTPTESYGEEMAARQGGGDGGGMTPGEEMAARQGTGLPDLSGYRSSYEQAALAQGGDVTATPTPAGATDAQAEMFAQQGDGGLRTFAATESSDPALESQLRSQAEMAAQQGGGYVDPYADAAAQQIDTGLRTFSSMPQFNENAAELEAIARRQDAGLQTFAAPGSRYNRGAEQLRRQAQQRPSDTLQDRLEQAYMGRIDATDDPILASQRADQRLRQEEAQRGLVEQLSRYGVLRGGGDTASALIKMSEGNERNRLALEAAAAQRRQGDLRDALAFDQARSAMDIAQRGQSVQERAAADRLLDTALARDVTRAGQTGQFRDATSTTGFRDTLAAQEQRQRMALAEREQDLRERTGAQDIATSALERDVARAGLTGQFERQETLDAQERRQRMKLDMADATGLIFDDKGGQRETLDRERQRRELNIAESDQARRDRLADQDVATSALARDVTRAGLTGQFERQDTLQAQLQRQQMQLADDANRRADIAQEAGLLGEIAGEGSAPARTTLAGRELALREDLARKQDLREQQAAESALYGQVVTGAANQAPIATLEGQRAQSALDSAALAREATEAGLTGRFDGALTTAERDADLARRISEAGVTGVFDTGSATQGPIDTIQSQVIESSLQNEALNRALGRAGATGLFREEGDTADPTETLESRLRTAGLTGQLDDDITLAGREARQDLIGSILAASDPELKGRTDSLAEALTRQLGDDFGLDDVSGAMRIDAGNATSEEVAADLFPRLDGMSEEQQVNEYRRLADLGYDMRAIEEQVEQMREAERRKQALEEARRRREERERNAKTEEPTQEEIDAEVERRMRERGN